MRAWVEILRGTSEGVHRGRTAALVQDRAIIADINPIDQTKLVTVEITYTFKPILPIGWDTITLFGHSRGFIVID